MSRARQILCLAALALSCGPTAALVGPTSEAGVYAPHVVMALAQSGRGAGFCSGAVLAPNVVLTAAHCVAAPQATRVHFRDGSGAPVLMEVARVARHPGFRADAVDARARSIDLALIETKEPLPSSFAPVAIGEAANEIGAAFDVTGFGVAKPGVTGARTARCWTSRSARRRSPDSGPLRCRPAPVSPWLVTRPWCRA